MADERIRVVVEGDSDDLRAALRSARGDIKVFGADVDDGSRRLHKFGDENDRSASKARLLAGEIGNVNRQFTLTRNVIGLIKPAALITGAGLAGGALNSMAAGGIAVTGALAPLSGLLGALPGGLAAVAQGMGTVKLATGGLSEAYGGNKKALEDLTPEARRFVGVLHEFDPLIKGIRREAQAGLFPGVTEGLKDAAKQGDIVKRIVGDTSEVLGRNAARAGNLVGSKSFGADLSLVGERNTRVLDRMARSGIDLGDALRHVTVAAGPMVNDLSLGAARLAHLVDMEAKAGRESGEMAEFFDEAQEKAAKLASIAESLAAGLWQVMKAGEPLGDDILDSLDKTSENWEQWTKSVEGKNELRKYFDDAKPTLFEAGRLVNDLTKGFLSMGSNPATADLIRQLRVELLPVLLDVMESTTESFGPSLIRALVEVAKVFGHLAGSSGPLVAFADAITLAAKGINALLDSVPGLNASIVQLAGGYGIYRALGIGKALEGIRNLKTGIKTIPAVPVPGGAAGVGGAAVTRGSPLAAGAGGAAVSQSFRGALVAGAKSAAPTIATVVALAIGPELVKKIGSDLSLSSAKFDLPKHVGSSLVEMTGGLLPAAGIDALAGMGQDDKKLRDFGDTAEQTARKLQKVGDSRGLAQLGDQARSLAREFPGSSRELRRFADAVEKAAGESVAGQFRKMGAAGTRSLRGIQRTVADTDFEIRNRLGPGTKAGKDALAKNFMLAAAAVRQHMREAGGETAKGVAQMRRYMRAALAEQGITGKEASRYIAGQDTITGKRDPGSGDVIGGQRGLTTLGARNQAGRDTIPILAAAGEDVAVFNRHQRAALDYSLAQTYGTDLRGLFGAVKQDHAMPLASNPLLRGFARGGIVALGHRLQGMGFQVGEHPAFGGVAPVHGRYGAADHYHGGALDVNHDQGGEDAALSRLSAQLKGQGWHVLWHVPDHFDHLHVDIGGGGGGGGGLKGLGEAVRVKRAKFPGGFGAMSAVGQGGLDDLRRAMQTRVDALAGDQVASGGVGDMGGGGQYDKGELKALWRRAGGAGSMANIMAAIALAESGGNPTARNPSGASGLWQILGVPFPGDPFDPLTNARMAVSKLGSQGLAAWEVYTKGSYRQYMQRGGLVDMLRAQGGFAPQPVATAAAGKKKPPRKVKHKPSKKLGLKKLRAVLPLAEIKQLASLDNVFEQRDATYGRVEREQGLTDETLTVTPPGSTVEQRNEPDIARRSGELGVLIGLRSQIRGLLSQQWAILAAASKTVGAGIAERIVRIRAIKDKVAGNVKRLRALKKALDAKPSDARRKAIKAEMKTLRDQNTRLAGEADKLGDGGELGKTRTALNTWREQKEGLDVRAKDLPGKLEDERLNIAELWKERSLVEGTTVPAGVTSGGGDSVLSDLVKQQLAESQEALRISRTEMGVFARFLPLFGGRLVGAFAHGGRIPETGVALVHRDEMITPDPQGPYGRQIPAAGGPVVGAAPQITLVFDSNSGELVRLVDARIDGQATKVVTEQAGRRTRMLVDAPGG